MLSGFWIKLLNFHFLGHGSLRGKRESRLCQRAEPGEAARAPGGPSVALTPASAGLLPEGNAQPGSAARLKAVSAWISALLRNGAKGFGWILIARKDQPCVLSPWSSVGKRPKTEGIPDEKLEKVLPRRRLRGHMPQSAPVVGGKAWGACSNFISWRAQEWDVRPAA